LQSPGSILDDRTTSNVVEACPAADRARRAPCRPPGGRATRLAPTEQRPMSPGPVRQRPSADVLHVDSPAPREAAGTALEVRSRIAESERVSARRSKVAVEKAGTRASRSRGPVRSGDRSRRRRPCSSSPSPCSPRWASGTPMSPAPWTRDGQRPRAGRETSRPRCRDRSRKSESSTTSTFHQGDVLYVIDPFDFQVTLDTSKAQLRQRAADVQVKAMQAERRQHLHRLATTPGGAAALWPAAPPRRRPPSTPPSSSSPRPT